MVSMSAQQYCFFALTETAYFWISACSGSKHGSIFRSTFSRPPLMRQCLYFPPSRLRWQTFKTSAPSNIDSFPCFGRTLWLWAPVHSQSIAILSSIVSSTVDTLPAFHSWPILPGVRTWRPRQRTLIKLSRRKTSCRIEYLA